MDCHCWLILSFEWRVVVRGFVVRGRVVSYMHIFDCIGILYSSVS